MVAAGSGRPGWHGMAPLASVEFGVCVGASGDQLAKHKDRERRKEKEKGAPLSVREKA